MCIGVPGGAAIRRVAGLFTLISLGGMASAGGALEQGDLLQRSKAVYEALTSYSDTGEVFTEQQQPGGPMVEAHHTFTTRYRSPRHIYFDFREDENEGGDRFVLRSDQDAVYTWWATTRMEDVYPPGTGTAAFGIAAYPTRSSALQILPLIFASTGLRGPLVNVDEAAVEGTEEIDGRTCYRLRGIARSVYAETGRGETLRKTTIWIDTETLLVRRVFEDTQRGIMPGVVERQTTTFRPVANPELGDELFQFVAPDSP